MVSRFLSSKSRVDGGFEGKRLQPEEKDMVGPNGLEPSTSSVSRKRSNQTELRAYMRMVRLQFYRAPADYGNLWRSAQQCEGTGLENLGG